MWESLLSYLLLEQNFENKNSRDWLISPVESWLKILFFFFYRYTISMPCPLACPVQSPQHCAYVRLYCDVTHFLPLYLRPRKALIFWRQLSGHSMPREEWTRIHQIQAVVWPALYSHCTIYPVCGFEKVSLFRSIHTLVLKCRL